MSPIKEDKRHLQVPVAGAFCVYPAKTDTIAIISTQLIISYSIAIYNPDNKRVDPPVRSRYDKKKNGRNIA